MILEQLSGESDDMRMRWRHGPRVGSEGRHRAIGDVIAWSYELCGDKQRLLFDRLSVFAPGYDVNPEDAGTGVADVGAELEAIEVVCADDVPIQGCEGAPSMRVQIRSAAVRLARTEIRELLERLVEQSLVSVHMTADTVRYFLLESLRLFAADRLAERSTEQIDEPARLARRHCYYYRDKVLHAQAEWFGPAEQELLNWAMGRGRTSGAPSIPACNGRGAGRGAANLRWPAVASRSIPPRFVAGDPRPHRADLGGHPSIATPADRASACRDGPARVVGRGPGASSGRRGALGTLCCCLRCRCGPRRALARPARNRHRVARGGRLRLGCPS